MSDPGGYISEKNERAVEQYTRVDSIKNVIAVLVRILLYESRGARVWPGNTPVLYRSCLRVPDGYTVPRLEIGFFVRDKDGMGKGQGKSMVYVFCKYC